MQSDMRTVELFCGTKSFSNVMMDHGHITYTVDNDPQFEPNLCASVLDLPNDRFKDKSMLWASPPCEGFSVASIGANWTGGRRGYIPKSDSARRSIALAQKTVDIIRESKPKWWFIENPRGLLRKMPFMDELLKDMGGVRHTVTYCQYGDTRMKPTDIWTNATWWKPRPVCKNGMPCHIAAPRGAKTGTQGIKGYKDRSRIPKELFEEILSQFPDK
jgi:hypothetical protein